jgi:hypothetical protein
MKQKHESILSLLGMCILGGAVLLTMFLMTAPAPQPASAPSTEFSAGRAMQDLAVIAREPHPMGEFPARAAVRNAILGEIRALGLEPQVQDTFGVRLVVAGWLIGGPVENVLVRLPGTDPDGALLLIAHYDSTPGAPGAGDNGTGVVTLLEILRKLHEGSPLRQDVIFLFVDGEEPGLIGSSAFVAQHPWLEEIRMAINLDVGRTGFPSLPQTSQGNGALIQALAHSADKPTYMSVPVRLFPAGDQDLVPFQEAGIPGGFFALSTAAQENHTMLDLPETVDPASLQHFGNHILGLVRHLADRPTLDVDGESTNSLPEQLYFPILGRLVHYPLRWAWPLAAVAGLFFAGSMAYGFRRKALTWKGLGSGLLTLLVSLALSLGVTLLLWMGIQALHPDYQVSPFRPHLSDDALYAAGFITLALAIASASIAVARKKVTALDLAAGGLFFWLAATIIVAGLIPEMSYLATWVLLAGSAALLLALVSYPAKHWQAVFGLGFLASAILATFLWIPIVHTAFQNPGLPMLWLTIGMAALWIAALLPALDWITGPSRRPLPAAALLAGLGLLLAGHFLVGKHSPPPLVNPIGYWLDAGSSQASWIAFIGGYRTDARTTTRTQVALPQEMDERQNRLLVNPVRMPYTDLFPAAPPFSVLSSEAPLLALDGPHMDVIEDEWASDRRIVKVKITTSMHDRLYVLIPEESPLLAITLPNNGRMELPQAPDWGLRFDGTPVGGMEITFEFLNPGPVRFLLVEEKTGLPSFPGLATQPQPGTMPSPGEFYQGVPTDFTAIYRDFVVEENHGREVP